MNDINANPDRAGSTEVLDLDIDVLTDVKSIQNEWKLLQQQGNGTIYQQYDWVRIAFETYDSRNRPFIIVGRQDGNLELVLPLVLVPGIHTTLCWVGGSHANTCCGLYSTRFLQNASPGTMRKVLAEARKKVRGIVVLYLRNQPLKINGYNNPMLELPSVQGPNPFYKMDLRRGLDAILNAGNGKRKRKLFRFQQRKANELGGFELVVPKGEIEINSAIDQFFEHKASRFKELGIYNVFAEERNRDFIRALALEPESDSTQLLRLYVLEVGGKMRAMYGEGIVGDYCQSCINAVVYDEFSEHSPGEMILYLMLEQLIKDGFERFDLGIGYERYKSSWCKETEHLMETIYPLSKRAVPFGYYLKIRTWLKDQLKSNHTLWNQYKRLRRLTGSL